MPTQRPLSVVVGELRKNAGLTAAELAERSRLSPALISRIENDEYKSLSLTTAKSLADGLALTLRVFLQEIGILNNDDRPSVKLINSALLSNGYSQKEAEEVIKFARYVKRVRGNN